MNIKVEKLYENVVLPEYKTSGAAAFDFESLVDVIINPNETKIIPTGLAFEIPEGYELQVRPRSGLSAKTKLRVSNSPGTIDSDYRGEVCIILDNISLPFLTIATDVSSQLDSIPHCYYIFFHIYSYFFITLKSIPL